MKRFLLLIGLASCFLLSSCKLGGENKQAVPTAAYETLDYIIEHNKAPKGYVGGRTFRNFEELLPKKMPSGKKISYKEWDIYPKIKGKNRGAHRIVTGSDKKAYYTADHYKSFIDITPK